MKFDASALRKSPAYLYKVMEILYKSKNFAIINKPAGMPSQSDLSGDKDAMTATSEALLSLGEKSDLWLVHRLDRVVGGLLVFARNKKSASVLSDLISRGEFKKEYLAVTEGECAERGEMRDYIYKDAKISKAFIVDKKRAGVKEAVLKYELLAKARLESGDRSLVKVELITGRYHQIRAQFSSRALSLVGDGKYGSRDKGARMPALFSHRISFSALSEFVDVRLNPDVGEYPWNLWSEVL